MQRSPTSSAPVSRQGDRPKTTDGKRKVEPAKQAALRDEFLIAMDKFCASIHRTIQQIEGEVSKDLLLYIIQLSTLLGVGCPCYCSSIQRYYDFCLR